MVANAGNEGMIEIGEMGNHTVLPYGPSVKLRTPHTISDCNHCRRIRSCQYCHDLHRYKQSNKLYADIDNILAAHPHGSLQVVILRLSLSRSEAEWYRGWQLKMDRLYIFWSKLLKQRQKLKRRKVPSGLGLIHFIAVYPHFYSKNAARYPHFHGVAVIPSDFDYQALVEFAQGTGIDIYPETPEEMDGGQPNYMVEEFIAGRRSVTINSQKLSGLEMITKSMRMYQRKRGGRLLCKTRAPRTRSLGEAELAEVERMDRLYSNSAAYLPLAEIACITADAGRLERLGCITRLLQAAHEEARPCGAFSLSARKLAEKLGISEKSIRQDLADLEQCGLLMCVSSTPRKSKEYRLAAEVKRRDDSNVDQRTDSVGCDRIDPSGRDCHHRAEGELCECHSDAPVQPQAGSRSAQSDAV